MTASESHCIGAANILDGLLEALMAFGPLYTPILFLVVLSRLMSTYDIPRSPGRKYVCLFSIYEDARSASRNWAMFSGLVGSLGWGSDLVMSSGAYSGW